MLCQYCSLKIDFVSIITTKKPPLISPSTGSASSGNSLYKRKYSPHIDQRDAINQSSMLAANAKRFAYHTNSTSMLYCIYCTKNDFENLEQLHAHVQQMHAIVLREVSIERITMPLANFSIALQFCIGPLIFPLLFNLGGGKSIFWHPPGYTFVVWILYDEVPIDSGYVSAYTCNAHRSNQ